MLIMHGTRDETVPIDAVRRFAEKNDLMLIEINGADHMFKDPARNQGMFKGHGTFHVRTAVVDAFGHRQQSIVQLTRFNVIARFTRLNHFN